MIDTRRLKAEINAELWAWFKGDRHVKIGRDQALEILAEWISLQKIRGAVKTKLSDTCSSLRVDDVLLEAMRYRILGMSGDLAARVAAAVPPSLFRKATNYLVAKMARLRKSAAAFL
jgi:hypothetical protein